MLLFVLPCLFLLVFSTPAPLLRTPTVSDAPQKGRYFVSATPRVDLNDQQMRRASYLDVISPRLFLKSFKQDGSSRGAATSPFSSPADYFAQRKAYSAYSPPAAAAPLYAPSAMSAPVPTVTYDATAYQQSLPAPVAPSYASQQPAQQQPSAVYNVVAQSQSAASVPAPSPVYQVAPVVALPPPAAQPVYALPNVSHLSQSAPVSEIVYTQHAPVVNYQQHSAPIPAAAASLAPPSPPVFFRPPVAAPLYSAPAPPPAVPLAPAVYAPRAMSVPVPTITVAASAPVAAAPTPVFNFIRPQAVPAPVYPSSIVVPNAPLALPAPRPLYAPQPAPAVPSTPVYIQGDSSSPLKNPFQISYLPQSPAAYSAPQTVQSAVISGLPAAAASAPSSTMSVSLGRPALSYLQIQNGQIG